MHQTIGTRWKILVNELMSDNKKANKTLKMHSESALGGVKLK